MESGSDGNLAILWQVHEYLEAFRRPTPDAPCGISFDQDRENVDVAIVTLGAFP